MLKIIDRIDSHRITSIEELRTTCTRTVRLAYDKALLLENEIFMEMLLELYLTLEGREGLAMVINPRRRATLHVDIATFPILQSLKLINYNLSGHIITSIFFGYKHYVTFIKDFSHYKVFYLFYKKKYL